MTAGNDNPGNTRNGLVFHGFGVTGEQVAGVFRSALNAAAALPVASIEIVIQGKAVTALAVDGGLSIPQILCQARFPWAVEWKRTFLAWHVPH